jgi:sucrose-6-phosphate hydrolase SacC (GH32 family)
MYTNYNLLLKPAAELVSLRTESRTIEGQRLNSSSENPLSGFAGDCLEIEVELSFEEPTLCQLSLRASPDGAECTTIAYDSAEESLVVDGSKSSLDPDVHNQTFSGRLAADPNGLVRFHAFLDRSILEVFLGDSACITQRLYPTREDSLSASFTVKKGTVNLRRLTAWKLASVW